MPLSTRSGIVKLKLTAVFDAQHGGFMTGWSPVSWGSIDELFVNLTMLWVANYYSARNPLRLSSLVILGVVARMFRCATRSSCWCT